MLEKTQGNNFRTRVYPLPAKGTRRIVIAYEQELMKNNEQYMTVFVPVEYQDVLKTFSLDVSVFGDEAKPQVEETPWGKFKFDKSGEAYLASYKANDYKANGQLVFSVPDKKGQQVFVEKGKISGENIFFAQVNPEIKNRQKELPSKIALYWDASLSMSDRSFQLEAELLDKYFRKVNNLTVNLYAFSSVAMPSKTFKVKNGNWDELKKHLQSVNYDGATQLGLVNLDIDADEIILMTDGLNNFGKTISSAGKTPVVAVSSTLKADYSLLQYLAVTSGGKYINLAQQTTDEALEFLLKDSYRFISADYNHSEIAELTTSNALIRSESGFSIAGKLKTTSAAITLNFGIGKDVLYTKKLVVNEKDITDYDNITERIWAAKKVTELDLMYDKNKKEIEELGRKYNIVTRNTSLIVLDRIEDYIEHKITPPAELMEEYNRRMDKVWKTEKEDKKQHIEWVVSMFNERKEWWNREFPKTKGDNSYADAKELSGIDIAELREERVIVAENEEGEMQYDMIHSLNNQINELRARPDIREEDLNRIAEYHFTPPAIMADEPVAEESVMMVDMVAEEENNLAYMPQREASIKLSGWNSDMPYLKILKEKKNKELYQAYLDIRGEYRNTPSFYLDVATLFEERGLKQEALIILSNLAELEIESYRLIRVLAHRLQQLGYSEYAILQFETVLELRPEEPQSYRDLALAFEQDGQYQKAVELLYNIVERRWDGRFPYIEVIAAEEMNKAVALAQRKNVPVDLKDIDKRLLYNMTVDVRIVLNWDTDNSDMDLWVTDPHGERCFYSNQLTHIGGMISRDFTGGYGPEEFLIRNAVNGKYKIQANYYGSGEQTLIGPTTIYLDIFTRYSTGREKKETITLRLTENKEVIDIGEVTFSNK